MESETKPKTAWLDPAIGAIVLAVVVVHATSWAFSLGWLGELLRLDAETVKKAPHFALVDVLIWLAGLLLFARILIRGEWRLLKSLPLAGVVLAALAVASMLTASNRLTALADVVQITEYFVVLYLVVVTVVSTRERLRLVTSLWLAVASAVAIWALVHYLQASERAATDVSGPFLNRNLLGGYLAMAVPLAWGLMLYSRSVMTIIATVVFTLVALVVTLSGGPWLAMVIGVLVVTTVRAPRWLPVALAALLALVIGVFPYLPRNNASVLEASVRVQDENESDPLKRCDPRWVRSQAALKALAPDYFAKKGRRYHEPDGASRAEHVRTLLVGAGIGNYEKTIEQYYLKPQENVVEPNTDNLYFVLALSAGVPAALAFVWLLVSHLSCAGRGCLKAADPFVRGVLLGCAGSIAALFVTNLFTETLVRGSGVAMVLVFALSAAGARLAERKRPLAE